MEDLQNEIIVSISCLTYNHEQYIRHCLDGFLMQKCDFEFEILIHDDASADATQSIIKEYQQKYPDIIKPFFQTENQWSKGVRGMNAKFNYGRAKGKYIAQCEGDDYWIDPSKLQKQVDFLEHNSNAIMCFHSSKIKNEDTGEIFKEIPAQNRIYTTDDLLLSKVAHTASFVFRSNSINYNKISNKAVFGGDVMLALLLAEQGQVFGMQDYMSVYRKHAGGVTNISENTLIAHQKRMLGQYLYMKENIKSVTQDAFSRKLFDHAITIASLLFKEKKYFTAIQYGLKAVSYRPQIIYKMLRKPFKKIEK